MTNFLSFLKDASVVVASFGVFVFGTGYTLSQFGIGKRKEASDLAQSTAGTLTLLQAQVDSLQKMIDTERNQHRLAREAQTTEINRLSGEVGRLTGILEEKDRKLIEYKDIFQGRDPRMDKFMDAMEGFMDRNTKALESIDAHMKKTENIERMLLEIHPAILSPAKEA